MNNMNLKFMKIISILCLTALLLSIAGCWSAGNNPSTGGYQPPELSTSICENGTTEYIIVYPADADSWEMNALEELKYFLSLSTGIDFQSAADSDVVWSQGAKYLSIGENEVQKASGVTIDKEALGVSGFTVKTVGDSVFMVGGTGVGALYAVYEFLHYTINYEFYASGAMRYDTSDTVMLRDFQLTEIPDIAYREIGWNKLMWDETACNRLRLNDPSVAAGFIGHTSFFYFPKELYMADHPEWYATNGLQMCYSNAELQDALVEKMIEQLQANQDETDTFLMYGQEDTNAWCSCKDCMASKNKYGVDSASMIKFINPVAKRVREWVEENQPGRNVYVCVFAYQLTEAPPAKQEGDKWVPLDEELMCEENVCVMLAPLYANFTEPITAEVNKQFKGNLDGWNAICKNMKFWNYNTNFSHAYVNFNNFNSIQPNFQYFKEYGNVLGVYDQGMMWVYGSACFLDYRNYLHAKLMWDVDADVQALTEEFFENYYGVAADSMLKYFNEMKIHYEVMYRKHNLTGSIFESYEKPEYWSMGMLLQWLGYIEDAYAAIEQYQTTDSALYETLKNRICLESISVRYLLIELYGSKAFDEDTLLEMKRQTIADINQFRAWPDEASSDSSALSTKWGV